MSKKERSGYGADRSQLSFISIYFMQVIFLFAVTFFHHSMLLTISLQLIICLLFVCFSGVLIYSSHLSCCLHRFLQPLCIIDVDPFVSLPSFITPTSIATILIIVPTASLNYYFSASIIQNENNRSRIL